jgi:acyl transferase domain-containing protein
VTEPSTPEALADIAIVGMSGRFPGAPDLDTFWQNLRDGVESITFFSPAELEASNLAPAIWQAANFVPAVSLVDNPEWFDATFFGYTPREAELIDPQQRLFLECAWQALEHAGYDSENDKGLIGVYGGVGLNSYMLMNLYSNERIRESLEAAGSLQMITANDRDYLTTRISYKLNLKGPSVNVQAACSTSLVAVHLACQGLLTYQCDLALAGGVALRYSQSPGHAYVEGGVPSPDGHCRAFDAAARGTLFGSGVGIVVLKRLADALADGDTIHAVIKGSAINNDGALKVGYTAPSVAGQSAVIAMAHEMADIDPETISYIEAHGTGTPLGDPIEIAALTQVFRAKTRQKGFCAVGSVKTNIGHTGAAAGIAGLIKSVLALKHKQLPPSLHYESPNPKIDFANSPFYVNAKLAEWPANGQPRRAGVSSFGIGGTNAHVILEEAPPIRDAGPARPWQLLVLAARTEAALEHATDQLIAHLEQHPEISLADVAYTLQVGRRSFSHRRMLVCQDHADALSALTARDPTRVITHAREQRDRSVVFLFSGQGAQYVRMAQELYQHEPVFREQVDQCAKLLRPLLGRDLREIIYPRDDGRTTDDESTDSSFAVRPPSAADGPLLDKTQYAQPALFVIAYALAQLLMSWGVRPQALIGHSIGEYVAACLAGVFSLEDALTLVAARGRLMQQMPAGAMLAVPLAEAELLPLLGERIALAAINGPARCVASGPDDALAALERRLAEQGVECRRLHTSHAFHSAMMQPMLGPFTEQVKRVTLKAPSIPYISNVTGTWITAEEATDPGYWARHLRQTVRFADGLCELLRDPKRILLEIGPGQTLATFARQHPDKTPAHVVQASLRHPRDQQSDVAFLLNTLGQLWLAGLRLDWSGMYAHERRRRVPLPGYPFERQRYWVDPPKPTDTPSSQLGPLRKRPDIADWFSIPSWKRSLPPERAPRNPVTRPPCWLVLSDECGLGAQLVKRLEYEGAQSIVVLIGEQFAIRSEGVYTLNPRQPADYDALMEELRALDMLPQTIAHLWNVTPGEETQPSERALDLSFYSLLFLAHALGRHGLADPLRIGIVSNKLQQVSTETCLCPEKATLLGPCIVIPQEYPNIACQSIDIVLAKPGTPAASELTEQLIAELAAPVADRIIAYRGCHRWVQTFEPVRIGQARGKSWLRAGGVYLISGGLGGIGLTLADYLARTVRPKLVLTGRSAFPARGEWQSRLATADEPAALKQTIQQLLALEALGAEVLVVSADATDEQQMRAVIAQTKERFGALHGVIHAAGIAGGGLIQLKTPAMAERVLAPKILGVQALEAALDGTKLDFLVLCSSTIAITGGVGQVDYCAANAFLDAYAHASRERGNATIAINWDAWQEVGMAVSAAAQGLRGQSMAARPKPIDHPFLDQRIEATAQRAIYQTAFSPATHWVLAEHTIMGRPTLPGTAYLEIARAAFAHHTGARAELREIFFLTPLMIAADETAEVQTILEPDRAGFAFRVMSNSALRPGDEPLWQEHARGRIAPLESAPPKQYHIAEIIAACADRTITVAPEDMERGNRMVWWGPRWHSLKRVHLGAQQALAVLELPDEFAADLALFELHPALLDVATAVMAGIAGGDGRYLPLSYQQIKVRAPLVKSLYSYVKYKQDAANKETLSFDITLLDEQGQELVEITEFTLKRVATPANAGAATSSLPPIAETPAVEPLPAAFGSPILGARREPPGGILPKEGIEAFERLLCGNQPPQIVVSTKDINGMIPRANTLQSRFLDRADMGETRPAHPRPAMQSDYAAPRTELEQQLVEIWQLVLGISQVGIYDNYFELGGDSVQVIQIIARCGNAGLQLTPAQLFQHQTIAELAALIDTSAPPAAAPDVPPPVADVADVAAPPAASEPATSGDYTAADFPEAGLDQADLDRFLSSIQQQPE